MPDNNIPFNRRHEQILGDMKQDAKPEPFISQPLGEIPFGRYDKIYPGLNNEEYYAQKQSFLDKIGNGVAKAAGTFSTSFLEGTVGVINGLAEWASTGKFSSFYDNSFNRRIDDINKQMEDALPNYYTQAEKDAAWYSPTNLLSGNFLGDKILKNLGYSYGAILGGAAWGSLLKGIGLTSRLVRTGQGLKAVEAVESAMQGASKLEKFGAVNKALNSTWNSVKGTIGEGLSNTDRAIISSTGMLGEATIEALQATNEFRNKLIEDYRKTYGVSPSGDEMKEINKYADSVGNTVFGTNAALLTFSNYIQLPKILGSSKTAEKRAINNIITEGKGAAGKFIEGVPSTGNVLSPIANMLGTPGRFLNKNLLGPARLAFSTGEAIEEGLQYAAQTGSEDFFNRAYSGKGDADDLVGAIKNILTKGVGKALTDKEGIESILIGGLSGGIQKAVSNIKERGFTGLGGQYAKNTKLAIDALNKTNIEQALKDGAKYAAIGMQSQQLRQQAIVNNDTLGEKDYEKDFELSYILPRVKYGKVDSVSNDLSYYREQASTEAGFQELKDAGVVNKEEKREKFLDRLTNLENIAKSVNSIYEKLEDKYGGLVDKEGKRVYTPEVIDKMAYATAKVSDYDKRSIEILTSLGSKGINPAGLVSAISDSPSFKDKKYRDVMKESSVNEQINEINKQIAEAGEIDPEDTIREVGDFTDMIFLRQRYIDDINQMKVTPSEFESEVSPPEEAEQPEGVKKTVKIFRKDLNKEFELVVGKEYVGSSEPTPSKEGPEFKEYRKFTIVSVSEDGKTLSIRDQKGKVKESSFQEFEDYMNKYGWMASEEIEKKPDLKFAIEAAGKIFTYQLGKGNTKKGTVEYDMKTNALKFVTLDGKSTYYVKRSQFVAKEGFTLAQIYPSSSLSKAAQNALAEPMTADEIREKYNEKDEIISGVLKSSKERIEKINKSLEAARNELERTNEALDNLTLTKKGLPKKRFDKTVRKTIDALANTKERLEKDIISLEEERDELEITVSYFQELLEMKDQLPEESSEIIKELEEDVKSLEDAIDFNNEAIEKSKSVLKDVEEALVNALSLLNDFAKRLAEENPDIPISIEIFRARIEKFLGEEGAKQFIADRLGFTQAVMDLEEQISDFSNELDIPDLSKQAVKLKEEVKKIEEDVDRMIEEQIKKSKILEVFQRAADEFEKRIEEEALISNNKALQNAILGTKYEGPQTHEPSKTYEDARKSDMNVVNGSIGIMRGKAHQIRANNFGFRFNNLAKEVKDRIFGVYVTAQNEDKLGMTGLVDKFITDDDGLLVEGVNRNDVIVFVVVQQDKDGNITPIDEFGIPIPKEINRVETGVYQVMPEGDLRWSPKYGGESMFRDAKNEERQPIVKALTEQYKAKRDKILNDKESYTKVHTMDVSFGKTENVKIPGTEQDDFDARTSVEDAGLIDDKAALEKAPVLIIPTLNKVLEKKTVRFTTPLGMVFLNLANGFVKLKNKMHSINEAKVIFQAISRYAELVYDEKTDEPEAKRILQWLKSVVYWGIPETRKGERKDPGFNSIFFEKNEATGKLMLTISGKEAGKSVFEFSPSSLKKRKTEIIGLISGMYNNINNSMAGQTTQEYEEILSIAEDGTIESRIWKNYQSYLLSNTTPEGRKRASEDIPLATIARPLSSKEDVNRTGIYFYTTDEVDDFAIPEPKQKSVEEKIIAGKKPVPTKTTSGSRRFIEGNNVTLDGKTPMTFVAVTGDRTRKIIFTATSDVSSNNLDAISIKEGGNIKEVVEDLKAGQAKKRKEKGLPENKEEEQKERAKEIKGVIYAAISPYLSDDDDVEFNIEETEEEDDRGAPPFIPSGDEFTSDEQEDFDDDEEFYTEETEDDEASSPSNDVKSSRRRSLFSSTDDDREVERLIDERLEKFKPENWSKVETWLKSNFPNVPVYRVKNIIRATNGRQAWGMFKNGAIYIYENAEVGTVYHEVFHAVWRMFTDKEEQRKILAELRARKGTFYDVKLQKDVKYSEATPRQLEEVLAEEFRDYVQFKKIPAKPSEGRPYILKLFSDLITFIKEFFFGKESSSKVGEMFKKINEGGYKLAIPYETSLSYAKQGIIDIDDMVADEDAVLSMTRISDRQRNDIIQEMLYQSLVRVLRTDGNLFKKLDLTKSYVNTEIKSAVLDNLSRYLSKLKDKYNRKEISKDDYISEATPIRVLQEDINAEWESLTERYEEYLKSYDIEFDENDQAQLSDEDRSGRDNWTDATKIDSFKKANPAIKLLLSTIAKTRLDKTGTPRFIPSTVNGVNLIPASQSFITLMSRLHNSYNIEDMLERLKMLAKEDPNYRAFYKRITKNSYTDGGVSLDAIDKQYGSQLLTALWNTFKKQSPEVLNVIILENGEVVVGDANLSTAARQLKSSYVNEIIFKARNTKDGLYVPDMKKRIYVGNPKEIRKYEQLVTGVKSTRKTKVKFLNELGIPFKQSYLEKMTSEEKNKFDDIVGGIYKSVEGAEEIVTFSGKSLDIDGRLLELALLQSRLDNPEFSTTYFNISGERTQTFIGPNPVSELSNVIKGLSNLKDLASTPYSYIITDSFAQGSNVLERMFASDGDPISGKGENSDLLTVGIVGGVSNETNGKKKESSKLSYRERLIQELNLNFKGWYLNLVPGDASIEHMIKMGNAVSMTDLSRGYDKVFKIFGEYFKAELNLVREKNRKVDAKRNPKEFRFFNDIFDDKLKKDILAMTDKSAEEIYNNDKIRNRINAAIQKKLDKEADSLDKLLKTYNIASINDKGKYEFDSVSNGKPGFEQQSEKSYNDTLKFLSVNYMIANIELHKLVYSDPYQYSDELKRIKQFLSPRQMLVANSQEMNKVFDRVWNEGYKEGDAGYTKFNQEYFRTAVHDDVEGVKDLPGYDVFKETDGSGIATFKGYRHFRIRASNWNDAEERQYRYDMAWEKQDRGTEKLTKEEQDILDRGNPQVTSAYTTQKPSVAGTQLDENGNYSKDNYIVLDKFALYPLSYRVMKEINPTSNALKLYDKMMNEDIDYVAFTSARKVGSNSSKDGKKKVTHESYSDKGEFNTAPYKKENITNVPFSIIAVQAEVPSKEDYNVTRGSQITKLVTMDFLQGGVPIDFMTEEPSFEKRYEAWHSPSTDKSQSRIYTKIKNNESLLNELIDVGYKNTLKEFGIEEIVGRDGKKQFVIEDFEKVGNILRDEILKIEANDNVSHSLKYFIEQKSVIEATPAYRQVRNILYSIADRNFISQKINGAMKVQIPSRFLESESVEIREINGKKGYVSDTLKMYEERGKNIIELMLPRWFESSLSDEELINYFNNTEEGRRQLSAIAGVAFRIPTQNQNSFDSFVIAKFLPKEFGDNVVIPAALVEKAGSDFDIDKLSIYLKNVFVGRDGKPKLIQFLTDENSTVEERYVHWVRENSNVDTRKYIKFLTRSQVNNLRVNFEIELAKIKAYIKDTVGSMSETSYNRMKEEINSSKNAILSVQDSYMKELFEKGKELFWRLDESIIDEFLLLRDSIRARGVKGPTEIAMYLSLSEGLLSSRKNINPGDKVRLQMMNTLYKEELRVLGAGEESIKKLVDNALETFRKDKKADYASVTEAFAEDFETIYDLYEEAKKSQAYEAAVEIAEIDGLASIDEFRIFSIYKQNVKAALENAYIQSMQDLIEDDLNYDKLIKKNSAKRLKDLATKVAEKTQGGTFDYANIDNMLNRGFMSRLRHAFVTGKYAIGIAAVNQTNHSLNQRQLVFIDPSKWNLLSEEDKWWIGKNADIKFKKHNSIKVGGKKRPYLSGIMNASGEYISDIIGMFIDGYVDIAKGPWIMELGATPNVASTYLFLVKIGVPLEDVVYFMNQPIIRDYLKMIENSGYSWLFIDTYVNQINEDYEGGGQISNEDVNSFEIPNATKLEKSLGKKISELSPEEKKAQRMMLTEFLKYAKMAEQMFHVTQGSNFDTANFNDPLLVFKKLRQLFKAQNTMISSIDENGKVIPAVDALLKNSFLGKLVTSLVDARNAFSEILTSDRKRVRGVVEKVLLPYVETSDRDFVKIARKVVVDLFDWAVQTDQGFNKYLLDLLVNKDNVSQQVFDFIKTIGPEHELADNEVIRIIKAVAGKRIGGVNNVQLVGTDNRVYDQNNIIYGFRQLKEYFDGLEDTDKNSRLYERIKQLAVVQSGLSVSPISFTSLLPYEDFEEIYGATLNKLASIKNLDDFYNLGVFERNNWSNDDITPYERARWVPTKFGLKYNPAMEFLPKQVRGAVNSKNIPPVVAISVTSRSAKKDYIVYSWEKQGELLTDEEYTQAFNSGGSGAVTAAVIRKKSQMRLRGDYSFINKALMRKVKYEDSKNPYLHSYKDKEGLEVYQYVYVTVNAWGDSFRANEFYDVDKPSVLENGFVKVEKPVTDSAVISIFEQKKQEPVSTPTPTAAPSSPISRVEEPAVVQDSGKVLEGDIFSIPGIPVITTNLGGVHGAGLAQLAKNKGLIIQGDGAYKATDKVVQFPVKKVWSDSMAMNNNMELLKSSLRSLIITARNNPDNTYLLPLAGLGHGEGSVKEIMPLLINTVKTADNIKLVLAGENVNLGRQGTVRQDNTRTKMPEIKKMLAEAGLMSSAASGGRLEELEQKLKTKGLGPDEVGELTRLRIEKGKQIKKEC